MRSELSFDDAVKFYLRWAKRNGFIPVQPSSSLSERKSGKWVLENVSGKLAVVHDDGKIEI